MWAHAQAGAGKICGCGAQRKNCHREISAKALAAVRSCYWTLSSEVRSHLLRSLFEAAQGERRGTLDLDADSSDAGSSNSLSSQGQAPQGARQPLIQWQLCGQHVCFANFANLLGTSRKSITEAIRNEPDSWRMRGARELSSQAQVVEFFFYELYICLGLRAAAAVSGMIGRMRISRVPAQFQLWPKQANCCDILWVSPLLVRLQHFAFSAASATTTGTADAVDSAPSPCHPGSGAFAISSGP